MENEHVSTFQEPLLVSDQFLKSVDAPTESHGSKTPVTRRGRETRERLIKAAHSVFSRDGYAGTGVREIAAEADVALGSFYNYFDNKADVLHEVMTRVIGAHVKQLRDVRKEASDPLVRQRAIIASFARFYRQNSAVLRAYEEAALVDSEAAALRLSIRQYFIRGAEQDIRQLQNAGLADLDLDSSVTAAALVAMVDNFTYMWLIFGNEVDEHTAIETLSRIWTRAIGLRDPKEGLIER